MNRLGGFKALTTALVVGFVLCAVLDVVAVFSDESYRSLIQRAIAGGISVQQADSADQRQTAIGFWQFGIFLVTAILFLIWFRRAYANVPRLGVGGMRHGPRWAVGAWFVPFLCLVRPKAIADDIWRGSDPKLAEEDTVGLAERVPWYFNVWWAMFIISSIAANVAFRSTRKAETLSSLRTSTMVLLVSDALDLVAAVAAVAVVMEIFRRQRERASSTETLGAMA
jgi:hypothetical protein